MTVKNLGHNHNLLYKPIAIMFMGALGASFFSELPGQIEVAMVFNVLMAAPALLALIMAWGWSRAFISLALLSGFAYGIESVGVLTGWPYGSFQYGASLGPKLFNLVPLLLPLSYVPLVIGSLALLPTHLPRFLKVFLGMLLLVAYDLVLDPGAVKLGYWSWNEAGAYYGIPLSNYLGWVLSGFLAMILISSLEPSRAQGRRSAMMLATYLWGISFWSFVALFHAMWLPMIVGFILLAVCIMRVRFLSKLQNPKKAKSDGEQTDVPGKNLAHSHS